MAARGPRKTPLSRSSRNIIASLAISADGFIARPDGGVEWLDRPRPKGDYDMGEFYRSIDTILMGRKTYDFAVDYQKSGKAKSVFDPKVKNYLFSRTIAAADVVSPVELVSEPVKAFAQELRAQPGKNIWMMGGGGLIASFLDAGEMDEFILSVIPVFIGEGIPLIAPRHRKVSLKLLSSKAFSDGVVQLHYRVGT